VRRRRSRWPVGGKDGKFVTFTRRNEFAVIKSGPQFVVFGDALAHLDVHFGGGPSSILDDRRSSQMRVKSRGKRASHDEGPGAVINVKLRLVIPYEKVLRDRK